MRPLHIGYVPVRRERPRGRDEGAMGLNGIWRASISIIADDGVRLRDIESVSELLKVKITA